ncbi:stage II sporulation protein R [Cohnella endophytica]|uniref:Stage II sporulation protein R n=1 Tax=Cohnella endophytica TaxID=2419778 RepID=A0A494XCH2_9BACL|nr:stage II sporulation protein R [Cohnella endophytica]RKP47321.1 stage II sporulation protein R [Cohnella endophytica]
MRISHHSYSYRYRRVSQIIFFLFAIFLGLSVLFRASVSASANASRIIPDDAIRIRIIANSDKASDQNIKASVRDDVAAFIKSWGAMPDTQAKARAFIRKHLPQIQAHVDGKLRELNAPYEGVVELAKVPFPEKAFDGATYAAGDYEALRITLGEGSGANWWCVLFPPLCLTAATADDDKAPSAAVTKLAATGKAKVADVADVAEDHPKAKFFLWELLEKLFSLIASWF